jgi:hypothetical protein
VKQRTGKREKSERVHLRVNEDSKSEIIEEEAKQRESERDNEQNE